MRRLMMLLFGVLASVSVASAACLSNLDEFADECLAVPSTDNDSYLDLLAGEDVNLEKRQGLVMHYCDVLLGTRDGDNLADECGCWDNDPYRYDAKQSMFVYALCANMDQALDQPKYIQAFNTTYETPDGEFPFNLALYIQEDVDLNEVWGIPAQELLETKSQLDGCDPTSDMQGCNFGRILPEIFTTIMNDLSNLKLASMYGYNYGDDKESRELAIRDFATTYFGEASQPEVPCNDDGYHYLRYESLAGNKAHCMHPRTYNLLDSYLKAAKKFVRKTDMIDGEILMETQCGDPKTHLLGCALAATGGFFGVNDTQTFQNVILNELLWYKLFITFVGNELTTNANYQPFRLSGFGTEVDQMRREAQSLANEVTLAEQAVWQMLRLMSQRQVNFPIHIALMSYYEDLVRYRDLLARTYTPRHQLYYKFRNIQECSE